MNRHEIMAFAIGVLGSQLFILVALTIFALLSGCSRQESIGPHRLVEASFYGHGERLNRHTANGEVFRPRAMTAAHRTLPFGTQVKVLYGGRSVVVRINDRGPASWTNRAIDLSSGAASVLGFPGTGKVKLIVLGANDEEQSR